MKLGIVGLGKMGWGMTQRLRAGGVEVVGYDRAPEHADVASLAELVAALEEDGRVRFPVEVALTNTEGTVVAEMTVGWYVRVKGT